MAFTRTRAERAQSTTLAANSTGETACDISDARLGSVQCFVRRGLAGIDGGVVVLRTAFDVEPVVDRAEDILHLPQELRGNFHWGFYDGGHMMYTALPSLKKLSADVSAFLKQSAK